MSRPAKRKAGAVAVTSVLLVGTGVAVAYWTAPGSGSGDATTGTTSSPLRVVQTSTVTGLAPGVDGVTLEGTFDNPNTADVYVTKVRATLGQVTRAGAPVVGCDATDYTLTGADMAVGQTIENGSRVGSWSGAVVAFNDKAGVNQDACKGATVKINYVVDPVG